MRRFILERFAIPQSLRVSTVVPSRCLQFEKRLAIAKHPRNPGPGGNLDASRRSNYVRHLKSLRSALGSRMIGKLFFWIADDRPIVMTLTSRT